MEEGSVMMVGYDLDRTMQALEILEDQLAGEQRNLEMVGDYKTVNVSQKVVRIIHSYTNYVNHKVWHKK
jgi:UDP-N-acetylglucosamine 2-epimerase (non-hydrolysing)